MNYKNIVLCFIVLFSNVKSHCNETIVDYFNIDKTDILLLFCLVAIIAYLYDGITNDFNTINYIITYLKFYIFNFDPNIQDNNGWTPLYSCCINSNQTKLEIIKLLLAHPKINPNIQDKNSWTPLYSCCINSNQTKLEIIKLLLAHQKTNPNIQNKNSWTPLYSCCISGDQIDLEIINLLLNHPKINPNIKYKNGETPLYSCCISSKPTDLERINLLLNHPKIENNINYKQTELHTACLNNETTAIKELLTRFHPNIRDESGNTALHLACINNNATIVKLLIDDPRTSLDSKNKAENTPLIIAANSEKAIEIIPILITHRIGFDERQYLFYKACKNFGMINDIIKSIFSYYEVITINQQFHNCPKKNPLQLEQIRKNCIKILCEKKGYINPYQLASIQ